MTAHIECGYLGRVTPYGGAQSIVGAGLWLEEIAGTGTTTHVAPATSELGNAIFTIYSDTALHIAIGLDPDATTAPQRYLIAGTTRDFDAPSGSKVSVTPA